MPIKEPRRIEYCGECTREIDIRNPKHVFHRHNGTPLCASRTTLRDPKEPEIEVKFDAALRRKIDESGKDPSDNNNWELKPAANGNKGYRSWTGKGS